MQPPPRGSYFCVVRLSDGRQEYCGQNVGRAASALNPGTHYEWGETKAEAQEKAARYWEAHDAMSPVPH